MEEINTQKASKTKWQSHRIVIWTFQALIIFFKLIGLATFACSVVDQKRQNLQMSCKFQYSKLGIAYNLVLVGLMLASTWYTLPHLTKPDITFNFMLNIAQTIVSSISIFVILLAYCFGAKNLVQIGNRLMEVERELDNVYLQYSTLRRKRVFCVITFACAFQASMALLLALSAHFFYTMNVTDWLADFPPIIYLGWFMIQYFLLVSVIQAKFVDVNRAIDRLAEADTMDTQPQSFYPTRRVVVDNTSVPELLELRDIHAHLCDVSQNVSDFYSISILIAAIYIFFTLVFNGYYLILSLLKKQLSYGYFVDFALWWIVLLYPILLLTSGVTGVLNEISRTGKSISNLMSCTIDKETRFELQQISLQLLHSKVDFTAGGYFTIENAFFHSMISAVTTYLIILIQFKMESSSTSPSNSTQPDVPDMEE